MICFIFDEDGIILFYNSNFDFDFDFEFEFEFEFEFCVLLDEIDEI